MRHIGVQHKHETAFVSDTIFGEPLIMANGSSAPRKSAPTGTEVATEDATAVTVATPVVFKAAKAISGSILKMAKGADKAVKSTNKRKKYTTMETSR